MMRVAVIGSTGQLGSELLHVLRAGGYEVFSLGHGDIECTDPMSVETALTAIGPDVVVNAAACVGVDACEDQVQEAFGINAFGALNVARVCARLHALCVYVSTDYVFDGGKGAPYTEEDHPSPVNIYGASKLAGECLVRQTSPRWLIVRMASLIGKAGARGKSGNFIEAVLAKARAGGPLRVINDIRMSPPFAQDAARALERMIRDQATGMLHLTNAGSCTWYEFARAALALTGLDVALEPISARDYPARARRPRNSSLESTRINGSADQLLRPWQVALKAYLVEKGHVGENSGDPLVIAGKTLSASADPLT